MAMSKERIECAKLVLDNLKKQNQPGVCSYLAELIAEVERLQVFEKEINRLNREEI